MRVSIVVPALDEAGGIVATLAPLQPLRAAGHEVIVVDGGSADATLALAAPLADRAFAARRGRAAQMNAGAAVAAGEVLLFLHADTQLSGEAFAALLRALPHSGRRWGRFDVAIAGRHPVLRVVAATMNARSRLTGIATGDQGIFTERALFAKVGGYPDQPLMEDVEISRRLKRAAGRPLCVRARLVTSGRQWDRRGPWRTVLAMWRWRYRYWRGTDPVALAAEYPVARGAAPVVLQVFARNPVAGAVKTRLAAAIGAHEAAALYADMVERTLATAVAARGRGIVDRVELWCTPAVDAPAFATWRARYGVTLETQTGTDLGERMANALGTALDRGARAILVGTDCPVLDASYLAAAVRALDDHDAVFGPVEDGGYVLVGLARRVDAFSGVPWSAPDTMAVTRARMAAQGTRWRELPPLWDVDLPADLRRWQEHNAGTPQSTAASTVPAG